jgi:hypothetical protein
VDDYLAHDASAASVLVAVYTSESQKPWQPKPHAATIAALTCALAERGMTIRDGLLVGDKTVSQYNGDPQNGLTLPPKATHSSQINAEGDPLQPDQRRIRLPRQHHRTDQPHHPAGLDKGGRTADAVDSRVNTIHGMNARGGVPVLVAEADRRWLGRNDPIIEYWSGRQTIAEGLTLHQTGGHFPGSAVVHWAAGAGGRGVLLSGDSVFPNPDRRSTAFMRSYPNHLPLSGAVALRIAAQLGELEFDRI